MHPNLTLRNLVECLGPDKDEMQEIRGRFDSLQRGLIKAFPHSRFVPIGSHRRGTAIAVHSPIDILVVLQPEWATWGGRHVHPSTIIHLLSEYLLQQHLTSAIRKDGRAIELYFKGRTSAVNLMPAFAVRVADQRTVYTMIGDDNRWIEASPEWHNAFFAHANACNSAKLQAISQLIKIWNFSGSHPFRISGTYVDMLLATSDIAAGVKSYGQCLNDFFGRLVQTEIRSLPDPAGVSSPIVANSSAAALDRLYDAARAANELSIAALDAQARGDNTEANRQWGVIFKRRISRRHLVH
jgi:Second Messenger Oligonucleotide or Dinucleotide Synthetase domain